MEKMSSLSNLLRTNRIISAVGGTDRRMMKSFKNHRSSKTSRWRRVVFGAFVVPKPVFAALFLMALAGLWAAFEIGKIASTTISMTSPAVDAPVQMPPETTVQTVFVEVPAVKEKMVTRIVFVRERKSVKTEKSKSSAAPSQQNDLPLYSSTVADNGYFTDVSLKGFQPSAEISAKIIKEVKENEK
jgi:hypothetical protein